MLNKKKLNVKLVITTKYKGKGEKNISTGRSPGQKKAIISPGAIKINTFGPLTNKVAV